MRAVNADTLIPKIKSIMRVENQIFGKRSWDFSGKCLVIVENEPTIEPERKKGHWIETMEGNGYRWQCSVCKKLFLWNSDPKKFCGNCGAAMHFDIKEDTDD